MGNFLQTAEKQWTLEEIATHQGVNVSTVSRALNGEYGVHPDTREHVAAVAQRLRYRPNRVARGLVTGRSHTLALVVSGVLTLAIGIFPEPFLRLAQTSLLR